MSPKATRKDIDAARVLVYARDSHYCQMCGRSVVDFPSSVHHRINRGSGGSAKLERASLLIRLCGTGTTGCHGWITEEPGYGAGLGYVLPKLNPNIDPTQEPILTHEYGWVLLDDEGGRTPCERREATA